MKDQVKDQIGAIILLLFLALLVVLSINRLEDKMSKEERYYQHEIDSLNKIIYSIRSDGNK